ncbi:MAG: T9SS type A sorting domain-containing protein [Bacteroidota bacterium]
MRNYTFLLTLFLLGTSVSWAQNLDFGIGNKVTTATNVTFDVVLSADSPFKLGSGQLYFNFNTNAFGEWAVSNNRVAINFPDGCVLSQKYLGFLDVYSTFVTNDNTGSRFSFSWQQAFSSGAMDTDNITNTPAILFQVVIDFNAGGQGEIDDLCFESGDLFDDQTFTACGPATPSVADCFSSPGTQLTNDNFTCFVNLPIELVSFDVQAQDNFTTYLEWQTLTELNNDYFTVERSFDGHKFYPILQVNGAGNSQQQLTYEAIDPNPQIGVNYYRLKQTDFDGTYTYSEIRTATFERPTSLGTVEVFPNPTTSLLNIELDDSIQNGQVQFLDARGQLLLNQLIEPFANQFQFQVDRFPAGIYWVRVETGIEIFSKKVIIVRE